MNKEGIYLLNNIKIKQAQRITKVISYNSKFKVKLLFILYKLGYISSFKLNGNNKLITYLKYIESRGVIRDIEFISKPSRRIYIKSKEIKKWKRNHLQKTNGFLICSTSKGLMTDQEMTLLNIGGELLFRIW